MAKPTYRVKRLNIASRPQYKATVVWKEATGKRSKKYFETVQEAETYALQRETELMNQGREALSFSTPLRVMAQECQAALSKHGKTLRDATAHYLEFLARTTSSVTVEKAVAEFIALKERRPVPLCAKYIANLHRHLGRLCAAFPGKLVSEFTAADCEDYLSKLETGAANYNAQLMLMREFFKWSAGKGRKWCGENPAGGIDRTKEIEQPVGILTPDQLTLLLEAACPEMLAYVAIGAFAGLRAAELDRLEWQDVDFEEGFIEVTAAKAKSARRRLVKMQPCLRAWLEPIAKARGRCVPVRPEFRLIQLRRRVGIDPWPKNALRHSFASYHIARFKNAAELALEMGHNSNNLIFQHYRQVVRESVALQWWNILPRDPENVLRFASRNAVALASEEVEREHGTGRFPASQWRETYTKTIAEYVRQYGVERTTIRKWMRIGKPLDDAEAMAKLQRGEYAHTAAQHAKIYGVTLWQAKLWREGGWPLDNIERTKAYLAFRCSDLHQRFPKPANTAFRVIPLSAADAKQAGEALENARAAKRSA